VLKAAVETAGGKVRLSPVYPIYNGKRGRLCARRRAHRCGRPDASASDGYVRCSGAGAPLPHGGAGLLPADHVVQQSARIPVNIDVSTLHRLADQPNIVALKESAPDPRRFTDILNALGDRFILLRVSTMWRSRGCAGARGWVFGSDQRVSERVVAAL